MKGLAPTALLIAASQLAPAADLGEWRDLNLKVEPLGESVQVNGLPLEISKFTGSDVVVLAKRMGDKWIGEEGAHGVRTTNSGPWKIISRFHGAGLEVVQWTNAGNESQLLWSRSDLQTHTRSTHRGGFGFPPVCMQGRAVSGRVDAQSYWQQTALCKGSPRNVLASVRTIAGAQGYEVQSREGQLLARSGNTEITILAWRSAEGPASAVTSLVYLRLEPAERAP
jgi:hypothetical protein